MSDAAQNGDPAPSFRSALLRVLVGDVVEVLDRLEDRSTSSSRRDAIRTVMAAIEGAVWHFRQEIRSLANELDVISPSEEMALREVSYQVTAGGNLTEQARYIKLTSIVKFTIRIAQRISDELIVNFSDSGWSDLIASISTRNRVTHPKNINDLEVTSEEVEQAVRALFWSLETMEYCLAEAMSSYSSLIDEMRDFLEDLKAKNPKALAAYQEALRSISDSRLI